MDDRLRRLLQGARAGSSEDRLRLAAELGRLASLEDRVGWAQADPGAQDLVLEVVGRLLEPEWEPAGAGTWAAGGARHRIGAFRHRASGAVLHLIPGGTTRIGPAASIEGQRLTREVRLRPFLLGRYPLLQAEWDRLGGEDQRSFVGPHLPIEGVSWRAAQAWLRRAGGGLRLPSEAEWEHAARAGTSGAYYWGEVMNPELCWFGQGAAWRTHPPREHLDCGNAFGLVDVLGNVAEWCQDAFLPWRQDLPADGRPAEPPLLGAARVLRGGDGFATATQCTCAARNGARETDWGAGIGLRVARSSPL